MKKRWKLIRIGITTSIRRTLTILAGKGRFWKKLLESGNPAALLEKSFHDQALEIKAAAAFQTVS